MPWGEELAGPIFGWILKVFSPRRVMRWIKAHAAWTAPETHFSVLIADLDGDDANLTQTKHVQRALEQRVTGLRVLREGKCLRVDDVGDIAEKQTAAVRKGQAWLGDRGADVLVWGEVARADAVLRLRFLTAEGEGGDAKGYRLGDTLDLPQDFDSDLATVLTGVVLASVLPVSEEAGHYLVDRLKPVAARIERLLATPPPGLRDERLAYVQAAFGLVCSVLGDQIGDPHSLGKAIAAYRAALQVRTRERVPLDWAMTQNNLGNALARFGAREEGTALLEEAVAAYRAAMEVYTRERVPLDWATTQNNLGNTLSILGERQEGTARLEEAVLAYRATLEMRTRERVPLDWATTQNNLGNTLAILGAREEGTVLLEEAALAYRAALEVRTRERVPLQWAMTQNNLGNALQALGKREEGTARLEEAVLAYRAALEVRARERVPLQWATTQNNLGTALARLGEREEGAARLEEAVAAYRAALEVHTRERAPLNWAATQNNLGAALEALGEREEGTARLEEAVTAYRAALEVYDRHAPRIT